MERIGIRELRQHASRYVERAAGGERIVVTNRGHDVAELTPRGGDVLDRLERDGRLRPATADPDDLQPPPPRAPGFPSSTEALEEQRDEAR
jgi:prevent-host-death family protein